MVFWDLMRRTLCCRAAASPGDEGPLEASGWEPVLSHFFAFQASRPNLAWGCKGKYFCNLPPSFPALIIVLLFDFAAWRAHRLCSRQVPGIPDCCSSARRSRRHRASPSRFPRRGTAGTGSATGTGTRTGMGQPRLPVGSGCGRGRRSSGPGSAAAESVARAEVLLPILPPKPGWESQWTPLAAGRGCGAHPRPSQPQVGPRSWDFPQKAGMHRSFYGLLAPKPRWDKERGAAESRSLGGFSVAAILPNKPGSRDLSQVTAKGRQSWDLSHNHPASEAHRPSDGSSPKKPFPRCPERLCCPSFTSDIVTKGSNASVAGTWTATTILK